VTFDIVLNVLWCAIGVGGLLVLACFERRKGPRHQIGRVRRILAVLLVTVSLFPCVSATDDEFCLALLQTSHGKHGGVGAPVPEDNREKEGQVLARILLALDHSQVSSTYSFAVSFCFFGLVLCGTKLISARGLLRRAGRDPPLVSCA
jgi:hypothetical protein